MRVKNRLQSSFYSVVHGIAHCEDCDWETESYKNCRAIAAQHAKKHGHKVTGEVGIAFSYDYRGSAPSTLKEGSKNE